MHASRATLLARTLVATSLAFLLSAGSCAETDIGAPCDVPLSAPDTNQPGCTADADPAQEPQCFHPDLSSRDKDFVAFGATDCDNLVCVRSRCSLPENAPDREAACARELPTKSPTGICSGECITDDDCRAGEGLDGTYACRSLVLDQKFLEDLRKNLSAKEYEKYFGRIQSAKYCARAP